VLLGDAAHTVHPLAGQGLNLGLGDVAALAQRLQTRDYWRGLADARVLAAWERERRAAWATVGGGGDAIQRLFARSDEPSSRLRNLGLGLFSASGPLKRWVAAQAFGGGAPGRGRTDVP
jgi:2-polyprenyl-6-methoxyphenol hydroxylase-like FAD-dependent oxidoreductase